MKRDAKQPTRAIQEQGEILPVVENDAPADRFQNRQQVQSVESANDTQAAKSEFSKVKKSHPGVVVKQDAVARVLSSAPGGEVNAGDLSPLADLYGGNTRNVAGSAAYTPFVKGSRSDTRYGKRLDDVIKKLNFVPSEQVVVERDESKPIAESHDVQGYNGTYRNVNARAQKNNGGAPAATFFQRSLDEITRDQLYYTAGQTVLTDGIKYKDTPTLSTKRNADGSYSPAATEAFALERGNYLPRSLEVKFVNGALDSMTFKVDDVSIKGVDPDVANASSVSELIHINRSEVDRQKMDARAGDEKADIWTPLPRAVREPSATVAYLADLEGDTGDEVWMSYKKTALALSYQLNRAAKDGLDVTTPRNEALLGLGVNAKHSTYFKDVDPFTPEFYEKGCASVMLRAFDTTAKYATKADILMLPKTFKQFMQVADNNMNPLRCHEEFIATVNNREVFSTIDRPYDPLLPVFISDREALIHPYDWSKMYAFEGGEETIKPFAYSYHDLRNVYTVQVYHPLLKGIKEYLSDNATGFITALRGREGDPNEAYSMSIPIIQSTRYFSAWALLVLAATPYIIRERVNSMRDVLYYEKNVEYPFSHLVRIGDANPMNAVNYSNTDYQAPIVVGQMMPSTAISWVMPELFWGFHEEEANDYLTVLPWYANEETYRFTEDGAYHEPTQHAITLPSIRSGIRLGAADMLYSMSERDLRLCLDMVTEFPLQQGSDEGEFGVYKYDQASDGIPFVRYDKGEFTYKDYLTMPRELGYFIVAPYGLFTPGMITLEKSADAEDFTGGAAITDDIIPGTSSYTAKMWCGYGGTGLKLPSEDGILLAPEINVQRSTAYFQQWYQADCSRGDSNANELNGSFALSLGDLFTTAGAIRANAGTMKPFTTGQSTEVGGAQKKLSDDKFSVVTLQKAMWTRIQVLPFVISPWDVCSLKEALGNDEGVKVDPFDVAYAFGFCGFRASDFTEDVYNRVNTIANLGLTYLDDVWIKDSPIFKESTRFTQV